VSGQTTITTKIDRASSPIASSFYNLSHKIVTRFALVNTLLNYPHQTTSILENNQEILDYALVQLLETISDYMTRNNRQGAATFLKDIADIIQWDLAARV
jgi:hypothetical protein